MKKLILKSFSVIIYILHLGKVPTILSNFHYNFQTCRWRPPLSWFDWEISCTPLISLLRIYFFCLDQITTISSIMYLYCISICIVHTNNSRRQELQGWHQKYNKVKQENVQWTAVKDTGWGRWSCVNILGRLQSAREVVEWLLLLIWRVK